MRSWAVGSLVAVLAAVATGQEQLAGPGQFPQFRTLSGLPGGGMPIGRNGEPGGVGAWAFSTPVAYGLAPWRVVGAVSIVSRNRNIPFDFSRNGEANGANGTIALLVGVPAGRYGQLTFGNMVLSTLWDTSQNLQWTLPTGGDSAVAIGVQDISGQGGTQGQDQTGFDPGESRTYYAVATRQFGERTFASLGFGDTRFKGRLFGSVSHWEGPWGAHIEWDTFNTNVGVGYQFQVAGRPSLVSIGLVKGELAYWSVGFSF